MVTQLSKNKNEDSGNILPELPTHEDYNRIAIDPEETARLAYSYWLARSNKEGSAEDDWLRAEEELRRNGIRLAVP
jgi:hypothetical protein